VKTSAAVLGCGGRKKGYFASNNEVQATLGRWGAGAEKKATKRVSKGIGKEALQEKEGGVQPLCSKWREAEEKSRGPKGAKAGLSGVTRLKS